MNGWTFSQNPCMRGKSHNHHVYGVHMNCTVHRVLTLHKELEKKRKEKKKASSQHSTVVSMPRSDGMASQMNKMKNLEQHRSQWSHSCSQSSSSLTAQNQQWNGTNEQITKTGGEKITTKTTRKEDSSKYHVRDDKWDANLDWDISSHDHVSEDAHDLYQQQWVGDRDDSWWHEPQNLQLTRYQQRDQEYGRGAGYCNL